MAEETAADPQALIDTLTRQVTELSGRLSAAEGERDGFRAKLRSTTHKQAFTEAIRAAKADPKAVEALWKLSGYQPEADDIDPAAIAGLVAKAKEESPFAFLKDEPAPAKAQETAPKLKTPIDEGKGGKVPTPGKMQVKRSELANAEWMRANQDKLSEAYEAGNVEMVD